MMNLRRNRDFDKDFARLPQKHKGQVATRIMELWKIPPHPHDCRHLKGHPDCFRIDSGEYRIIYKIHKHENVVEVIEVGQRNDDDIYKKIERKNS